MKRLLESVTQICLGIWVGAMTGFAFTAPVLFAQWGPDRQRAGDTAGAMIARINGVGLWLGIIALAALLPRLRTRLAAARAILVAGALALAFTTAFYVLPGIHRAQPPHPVQTYAETDPLRIEYNKWHKRSEQIFGVAIVLAAAAIVLGPLEKETR